MRFILAASNLWLLLFGALSIVACFDQFHVPYALGWGRFQYLLAILPCVLIAIVARAPRVTLVAVSLATLNLSYLAPYMIPTFDPGTAQASTPTRLRILQFNVYALNTEYDKTVQYIRSCNPDIVLIEELTDGWTKALSDGLADYRYRSVDPKWIGTFSRFPIKSSAIKQFAGYGSTNVLSDIEVNGRTISVLHVHPVAVMAPAGFSHHTQQMDELIATAHSLPRPRIIAGDFNSPPWSSEIQRLLAHSNLRSAALGAGWTPTWPAFSTTKQPLLEVPIDHCFVDSSIRVESFAIGPPLGSDHLPLVIDLVI